MSSCVITLLRRRRRLQRRRKKVFAGIKNRNLISLSKFRTSSPIIVKSMNREIKENPAKRVRSEPGAPKSCLLVAVVVPNALTRPPAPRFNFIGRFSAFFPSRSLRCQWSVRFFLSLNVKSIRESKLRLSRLLTEFPSRISSEQFWL